MLHKKYGCGVLNTKQMYILHIKTEKGYVCPCSFIKCIYDFITTLSHLLTNTQAPKALLNGINYVRLGLSAERVSLTRPIHSKEKKADPLSDMQVHSELSFHFELDESKTQIKRVIP